MRTAKIRCQKDVSEDGSEIVYKISVEAEESDIRTEVAVTEDELTDVLREILTGLRNRGYSMNISQEDLIYIPPVVH